MHVKDLLTEDPGTDLQLGDTVWAKFTVESISDIGDVHCRYHTRPGHAEYAVSSIAAIFLWRESDMRQANSLKRFWRWPW